jgi:hypothetical protein
MRAHALPPPGKRTGETPIRVHRRKQLLGKRAPEWQGQEPEPSWRVVLASDGASPYPELNNGLMRKSGKRLLVFLNSRIDGRDALPTSADPLKRRSFVGGAAGVARASRPSFLFITDP